MKFELQNNYQYEKCITVKELVDVVHEGPGLTAANPISLRK